MKISQREARRMRKELNALHERDADKFAENAASFDRALFLRNCGIVEGER
jgi:hypothetical protein